jgi:hypothetical protein
MKLAVLAALALVIGLDCGNGYERQRCGEQIT